MACEVCSKAACESLLLFCLQVLQTGDMEPDVLQHASVHEILHNFPTV